MKEVIVKKNEAGQRLDKLLHKILPNASMGFLYKMLRKKNITWNGKKADGSEKTEVGDSIRFFLADETFDKFAGHAGAADDNPKQSKQGDSRVNTGEYRKAYRSLKGIRVLYESEDVLLVHKPAGILSQKAAQADLSLNEWLIGYLLTTGKLSEEQLITFHPSICNRLDRNTGGIVVCGISLIGSQKMNAMLKERSVHKFYRLLVKGTVQKEVDLQGWLKKDEASNKVQILLDNAFAGLKKDEQKNYSRVETRYYPVKNSVITASNGRTYPISLLEAELITGKTHQIRAHLASDGYPLLGDYKYGDRGFNEYLKKQYGIEHQLLHAYRLEFPKLEAPFEDLSGRAIVDEMPELYERLLG